MPRLSWGAYEVSRDWSKVTNISERLKTPESPGLFRTQEVEHFPRVWDLTRLRLKHLKISWPDWLRTYRHAQIDLFNYTEMKCQPELRFITISSYPWRPRCFKSCADQTTAWLLVLCLFFPFSVPSVSLFDFPFNEEGFNEASEVCFCSSIYTPGRSCSLVCCTEEYTCSTLSWSRQRWQCCCITRV